VRDLRAEFDRFKETHNDFAVRTINEIDELFAKVEATGPTWQEAGSLLEDGLLPYRGQSQPI
jgi:hypothetical protein